MEIVNKKIETKAIVTTDAFRTIYINECFGWRYNGTLKSDGYECLLFQRDLTNIKEYGQLVNYEAEYYNLTYKGKETKKVEKKKLNILLLIVLLLLFIIPGIIYLIIYFLKKDFEYNSTDYKEPLEEFWRSANRILWTARQISFGSETVLRLDFSRRDNSRDISYANNPDVVKTAKEYKLSARPYGGFRQYYDNLDYAYNSFNNVESTSSFPPRPNGTNVNNSNPEEDTVKNGFWK